MVKKIPRTRRFKASILSETVRYSGIITAADLRKQFNIPEAAEITVDIPSGGDWSGESVEVGGDAIPHIKIEWEEVK